MDDNESGDELSPFERLEKEVAERVTDANTAAGWAIVCCSVSIIFDFAVVLLVAVRGQLSLDGLVLMMAIYFGITIMVLGSIWTLRNRAKQIAEAEEMPFCYESREFWERVYCGIRSSFIKLFPFFLFVFASMVCLHIYLDRTIWFWAERELDLCSIIYVCVVLVVSAERVYRCFLSSVVQNLRKKSSYSDNDPDGGHGDEWKWR